MASARNFTRHSVAVLLLAVLLSACQTRVEPPVADNQDWLSDSAYFSDAVTLPSNWYYAAKAGLVANGKSEQANLTWQVSPIAGLFDGSPGNAETQENVVRLFGPLGAGAIKLEFGPAGALLTDSKGQEYRSSSAESLLVQTVEWPLPMSALRFWLFAQPAPESAYRYQLNPEGQLSKLEQLGWQLQFKDWRDYQGRQLPRKVFASKTFSTDDPNAPLKRKQTDIEVKLITKSWRWE